MFPMTSVSFREGGVNRGVFYFLHFVTFALVRVGFAQGEVDQIDRAARIRE
jgi:hypothetical protein